ncbi:hypothetical protein LXL04_024219 [Taraxacum kok-saghyz]
MQDPQSGLLRKLLKVLKEDFGTIDILMHSLANGPEQTPIGNIKVRLSSAISASNYSYVSLLQHFIPIMNPGCAYISLTYVAFEKIIPGYGGGMSPAKAALESDTKVLEFEAGRKHKVRVNTISAGPLRSRAAKSIGFIDMMIDYSSENAPLMKEFSVVGIHVPCSRCYHVKRLTCEDKFDPKLPSQRVSLT